MARMSWPPSRLIEPISNLFLTGTPLHLAGSEQRPHPRQLGEPEAFGMMLEGGSTPLRTEEISTLPILRRQCLHVAQLPPADGIKRSHLPSSSRGPPASLEPGIAVRVPGRFPLREGR